MIQENGVKRAEQKTTEYNFREKPHNIATIDFGTTSCSVSYLFNAHRVPDDEKPTVIRLDKTGPYGLRVPTCIIFNRQGKKLSFGHEARNLYKDMDQTSRPNHIYFEHVKMKLHHDANVDRNQKVEALNGKQYFLIDVIAHILCHLKECVWSNLIGLGRSPANQEIDWVITVPAIWKSRGKQMMREAGYKAGLCTSSKSGPGNLQEAKGYSPIPEIEHSPHKLSLALESESAAIYCQQETQRITLSKEATTLRYLVLDIGGGTVDIASHSISTDEEITELAPSIGNDWGGTRVNQEFEKFLASFIGDPGYFQYLGHQRDNTQKYAEHKAQLIHLIYTEFETQKILFGSESPNQSFKITFPHSFWKVYEDGILAGKEDGIQLEDDGMAIRIMPNKMAEFFKPVVNGITELIKSHISSHGFHKIFDMFYSVGGFGGCKFLRQQIDMKLKALVPNWCTRVPPEPNLAVIYGATVFRCNPAIVKQRRSDASYGIRCLTTFNESIHRPDYKVQYEEDGKHYCKNLFNCFVQRGDLICTDKVFVKTYSPVKKEQKTMDLTLYSSLKRNVWYTTDDEVYKLGEITIDIGGTGLDREVEVILDVTHTELQLLARDKTSGNERKLVTDFLEA